MHPVDVNIDQLCIWVHTHIGDINDYQHHSLINPGR